MSRSLSAYAQCSNLSSISGRPEMSDAFLLSGISGLSFKSTFLPALFFFCSVLFFCLSVFFFSCCWPILLPIFQKCLFFLKRLALVCLVLLVVFVVVLFCLFFGGKRGIFFPFLKQQKDESWLVIMCSTPPHGTVY